MSDSPILERTLANGLTVLLRETHDAPLASFWVWYRVGSRDERPGRTGVSHWVEHMQFKGTPSLAKGAIFREVSRHGGVNNAMTSNDWTAYYETLPVDRLDLAIGIEADRMTNSLFDPAETESERTVILSERQGAENSPTFLLYEEVVGAAFRAHPYRHMVIGYETDLRAIGRDDLYDHYRRYYQPHNAVVVAAGDFDADELYGRIERAFGGIEAGPTPPPRAAAEPPQLGERRVTLRRPAPTAYLRMAFRTPPARHPDTAAILAADAVLSGGKGMGLGGGGPMGRSARLYRALVASGLARAAGSDFDLFIDPYLLIIGVTALPGADPDRIERVVVDELDRLRSEPISDAELARAVKQVKAQYVYSAEGVTNQAFWLGQMEIVDRYTRAQSIVGEIERVTPADVQRVAQTYFAPETRTVGWLFPEGAGGGADQEVPTSAALPRLWHISGIGGEGRLDAQGSSSAAPARLSLTARAPFERVELPNGIVVLGQARPADPTVVVRLRFGAGAAADHPDRPGLAAFTARMLARGTATRNFEQFNEATDDLGATVGVEPGRHFAEVAIRCLREDLPMLLDLAADIVRRPVFPEEEVEKVRNELLTAVREQENDTRTTADLALRRLLYPAGHPFSRRTIGDADSVNAIARADLSAFHAAHYGPRIMTAAIVGGIEGMAAGADLLAARFGDWDAPATTPLAPAPPTPPASLVRASAVVPGKSQADVAVGFPTVPRLDPSFYALDTANLILGRLGLMGRLGATVRDAQGLAYYVFSTVEPGREGSLWIGRAGVDPANVERALDGIVAEARRLRDEPVREEELADAKSYLTGVLPLALETNDGVAATLLNIEHYDLGLDYLDRYPAIITGLTTEQLQTAAQQHLDPDRLAIGVAGPP